MKKHTLFIILIIGIALAIGIWRDNHDEAPIESAKLFTSIPLSVGTALTQPHKIPDFTLTDMNGKLFNNDSIKARWSFLFFGYSNCPNICPSTLGAIRQISQRLGISSHIQFVFISIDPEHDTPAQLKNYLQQEQFAGAPIVGVTGDRESINTLAKTIGIHISSDQNKEITADHIEHGGALLLTNPEGKLAAIFTSTDKPSAIARDFKELAHHYANSV
ncbi:MAG: hypothetical protein BGO43_06265 [Gammaproteobacteria bacterium 39-13]|nr:SCO family protein [Gammaproteobacteria bacterium]OJV90451.1 MAG: hypothetical protein BGO43_06265 [Gammaproteobacteria bacterium 39-13]